MKLGERLANLRARWPALKTIPYSIYHITASTRSRAKNPIRKVFELELSNQGTVHVVHVMGALLPSQCTTNSVRGADLASESIAAWQNTLFAMLEDVSLLA